MDRVKFYDCSDHAHIFYQNVLSTRIGDVGWLVLLDSIWSESSVFGVLRKLHALRTNMMMFERIHFFARKPVEYASIKIYYFQREWRRV